MTESTTPTPPNPPQRIEDLNIERELTDSYLTYAMSTIMDRALPDVRDGLKPSQRRILVSMNDLNLGPRSKHLKCAKIAGNTSGDYHPHGEAVIYPTLVRLGQDWVMRHPLIDPQGNFGSSDGDPAAAMRYTEARPTAVESELLADLNLDTVDYQPNYDERLQEPMVLPGKFPNLLVNGSTGIAVGMACNLLPHNLGEICDGILAVLENPELSLGEIMAIIPGPDFPTGGIIMGTDGIIDGYKSGRGKMTLRAKYHLEEGKTRTSIVIDEMPYGVIRRNIVEGVAHAKQVGNMDDVVAVNDESGRKHKVRIVIDLKRDGNADVVLNQLWRHTQSQITVSMINIALVHRQPRTMGIKELIEQFIYHRREVITRRTKFLLKKAQQRAHILEGLVYAVVDIDEVVRLIRSSSTREEAIEKLRIRGFQIPADHPYALQIPAHLKADAHRLSQAQAEAIGRLQLIQLVGLEIEKLVKELNEVVEEIDGYKIILGDPRRVDDIIAEDTRELKEKYANPRRTEISLQGVSSANLEDLIAPEDVVVTFSHNGYIKRLPADTYRAQGRGGRGIKGTTGKEGDFVEHLFVANTHDHLLLFTNTGRVFDKRVFDIPEGSRTSGGRSIANLLDLPSHEKIVSVLAIKNFGQDEDFLLFATRQGTVKKTALSAYANIRSSGLIAIGMGEDDALIGVAVTSGNDHVMLCTSSGLANRFEEGKVRAMGRPAGGVIGVRFKREKDAVVDMIVIPGGLDADWQLLTACSKGFGKRTSVAEYNVKGRGTQGVVNIDANERNGDVVSVKLIHETDEVMFISEKGILIRTRAAEVRQTGRSAQGVKLINLDSRDTLVAMATIKADAAEADSDTTEA